MPTLDEMFPSPWLKAEDFAEGEEKQLTIRSWKLNTLPSKNGEKPKQSLDLTFDETNKVLGANYTNREALAKVFGSRNPNDWVGKTATFMTLWVDSWGETVRAVRVKPVSVKPNGNGTKPQAAPAPAPVPATAATNQTLTVAKGFDMEGFRARVAKQYPYYTDKNGKPNPYHILKTLVKVGIYNLGDDNAEEAFAMLGYHAQAEEEAKQAA